MPVADASQTLATPQSTIGDIITQQSVQDIDDGVVLSKFILFDE